MLHIGIDFSISSPCVCFWNTKQQHLFENCEFFFLHSKRSITKINFPNNIHYSESSESRDNSVRFAENAMALTSEIKKRLDNVKKYVIMLEGYSMGAKGRLFDIGEATGIFKLFLSQENIKPLVIAPTQIKKLATGKGNANKFQMLEKFMEINTSLHNSEWIDVLTTEKHIQPPLTDLVDSFFIANSFTVTYD
jgi:Holliday junction resolvasome RuvABC endonuclease subunit